MSGVSRADVFDSFDELMAGRAGRIGSPWVHPEGAPPRYEPDYDLLARLLAVPLREQRGSESGRLAKGIDAWVAYELRRAGFPADEVWPRAARPRVLPREVGLLLEQVPPALRAELEAALGRSRGVVASDARVLGRAYVKQVDVLVSQWARGPELLVSTKSMVSSFRNNLGNRFEESYGDAKNLRGRYPMASMGFLFVFRSTLLDDRAAFERAMDMLRKLRAESDVYDTTCAVIAEWTDQDSVEPPRLPEIGFDGVTIRADAVPADLCAEVFLARLVECVLERTPIDMHVTVRELRENRLIPTVDG